ncbi:hypothetical protein [Streptomyces sp. G45]|uniref:hypothetical protein n=1 Tax=Streptomyces sp. G45 TaxID=3406627 RepID=UPI003C27FF07
MAEITATACAVTWLTEARADVRGALAAWDRAEFATVPVGRAWDVVRIPQRLGWSTIHQMRADGTPLGPVLHTATHVEILVPPGTASSWYARRPRPSVPATSSRPRTRLSSPR